MERIERYNQHLIDVRATARQAMQLLDELPINESRTLFVLEGKKLVGTVTDGDIRRGLLKDCEITHSIERYMQRSFKSLKQGSIKPDALAQLRQQDIWLLPVLNDNMEVVSIIDLKSFRTVLPTAALIMAGGRGERLRPLTDTLPKPLLKVGNKPIIEWNIDRLIMFGIKKFYISIKYLGEKIVAYFGDGSSKNVSIEYIEEDEPMGTLGAASKIEDLGYDQLLVMNSDLLTNIDFEDFFNFFKESNTPMCTASIPYRVQVPYGIMETNGKEGYIARLTEKPTYTYFANAGIYFISKELLRIIPKDRLYNATDLMQHLIDTDQKPAHYPILQYWLDIGKYEDYLRAQEEIKHIIL